jgi:hypothetical protein
LNRLKNWLRFKALVRPRLIKIVMPSAYSDAMRERALCSS